MKLVVKELRSDSAEVVSSYERSYQGGETVLEFKRRLAEKGGKAKNIHLFCRAAGRTEMDNNMKLLDYGFFFGGRTEVVAVAAPGEEEGGVGARELERAMELLEGPEDAHVCMRVVFPTVEESGEGGRQCYYFAFLPQVPLFFLRMRISNQLKIGGNRRFRLMSEDDIVLGDDGAPLSSCGLVNGSTVFIPAGGDYQKKTSYTVRLLCAITVLHLLLCIAAYIVR